MSRGPLDLDKLAAAKLWLISESTGSSTAADTPRDQPYLAHALYALVPGRRPRRAATDVRRALARVRQPGLAHLRDACPRSVASSRT